MSVEAALQKAVVAVLKAANVADDRVYDRVPIGAMLPYVHFRAVQSVDDGADCVDGNEVYLEIDVWSTAVGKVEASNIASQVRLALNQVDLVLDEPYAFLDIGHRDTQIDTDDQLHTRARLTFVAHTERV